MTAVKTQIKLNLPDTEMAEFTDAATFYMPTKKYSAEKALEKFMTSAHYKKLLKVANIFDLQLKDIVVTDSDAYSADEVWYTVAFALRGETNVLRDMLLSLFAKFLDAVVEAEEDGETIALHPVK
jgi:hypothetical protein